MRSCDPVDVRSWWMKLTLRVIAVENVAKEDVVEVYVLCGPMFAIGDPIDVIGPNNVVVPDAFFKSVVADE